MKLRYLVWLLLTVSLTKPARAQYGNSSFHRQQEAAAIMDFIRYTNAKNNGENLKRWWKNEEILGVTFSASMPFSLRSTFKPDQYMNVTAFDTVVTGEAKWLYGFHMQGSADHLLFRVGGDAIVSFSHSAIVHYMTYQLPDIGLTKSVNGKKGSINVLRFGMPLTFDFKWGADVDYNPDQRLCFSVGGGMVPQVTYGSFELESTGLGLNVAPMIYASAGMFVGVCLKVRASWQPGSYALFRGDESYETGVTRSFTAAMPGTFNLGIGIMSRSYDWRNGRAWRTGPGGERSRGSRSGGGGRRRAKSSYGVMRMY